MATSMSDLKVRDVMSKQSAEIDSEDSLSGAVSMMSNRKVSNLLVYERGEYKGAFGYKQLLSVYKMDPVKTKIRNHVSNPVKIGPDASITELIGLMFKTGEKTVVVEENGKILGLITHAELLDALTKTHELASAKASDIMTTTALSVKEDDKLSYAVNLMHDHTVGRLPVINRAGKVCGVLEAMSLIKAIAPRDTPNAGKFLGEKILSSNVAVKEFMTTGFVKSGPEENLLEKLKLARSADIMTIVVTDDRDRLLGIIAPKDIVEHTASLVLSPKPYVQFLSLDAGKFENEEVKRMIDGAAAKISKVTDVEYFVIHAKERSKGGKRKNYSIRARLKTKEGMITVKDHGWDVIDTSSKLVKEIERIVMKYKEKGRDMKRQRKRDALSIESVREEEEEEEKERET